MGARGISHCATEKKARCSVRAPCTNLRLIVTGELFARLAELHVRRRADRRARNGEAVGRKARLHEQRVSLKRKSECEEVAEHRGCAKWSEERYAPGGRETEVAISRKVWERNYMPNETCWLTAVGSAKDHGGLTAISRHVFTPKIPSIHA